MRFFLPQRKELHCGSSHCAEGSSRVSAAASTDAHRALQLSWQLHVFLCGWHRASELGRHTEYRSQFILGQGLSLWS